MTKQHSTQPTTNRSGRTLADRRNVLGFGGGMAATLIAGVAFAASATSAAPTAGESTFIPIEPCRLMDTRPDFAVGDRVTPIGEGETHDLQVTGPSGECNIPAGATAVAVNATAVGASHATFVTFGPSGSPTPSTSNLNVVPNQPPTPNKVDVKLSAGGRVAIFNQFGAVDVIVDATGYYSDATLQEMDAALQALGTAVEELKAQEPPVIPEIPEPPAVHMANSEFNDVLTNGAPNPVLTLEVPIPAAGSLLVDYTMIVRSTTAGRDIDCGISTDGTLQDPFRQAWESAGGDGSQSTMSGVRVIDVTPGMQTVALVCETNVGVGIGIIDLPTMSALFVAD